MTHDEIKKALKDRGLSFTALANATGKKYQTLTAVSMRNATSKPAAKIISAGVGKPIEEVFPDIKQYSMPDKQQQAENSIDKAKEVLKDAGLGDLVA